VLIVVWRHDIQDDIKCQNLILWIHMFVSIHQKRKLRCIIRYNSVCWYGIEQCIHEEPDFPYGKMWVKQFLVHEQQNSYQVRCQLLLKQRLLQNHDLLKFQAINYLLSPSSSIQSTEVSQYLQTISGLWKTFHIKNVCIIDDYVNIMLCMSMMTLQTKITWTS
jgi:hypothetical protein